MTIEGIDPTPRFPTLLVPGRDEPIDKYTAENERMIVDWRRRVHGRRAPPRARPPATSPTADGEGMYTSIADANGNRSPLVVACSDHPQAPVSTAKAESVEGTALVQRTTWTCHECGAAVTPKTPED